jgi:pyridoxamine 5'-phosphate oxidase
MTIAELRREYNLTGLRRKDLAADPIRQFKVWFEHAEGRRAGGRLRRFCVRLYKALFLGGASETSDVNAMTLATVDPDGRPSARVVLLKGVDERGFIFYTNYRSRKGRELSTNPQAALVFYWPELERQVCVAGKASQLPAPESDDYFASRPRGSRLAAWASNQSAVVADRAALEKQWHDFEHKYPEEQVPRPAHWGGYVLAPERIEFWQGRPNRLHDRFCYTRRPDGSWLIERLSP